MTLTGENKICTSATLSVRNPAVNDLGFKLGLQSKKPRPPKRIKQKLWHRRSRRRYLHDHHTPKWACVDSWPPSARYCCVLPVDWAAHWSFTQAAEHFASLDYGSLKCCYLALSWTEPPSSWLNKPPTHSIEIRRDHTSWSKIHLTLQSAC